MSPETLAMLAILSAGPMPMNGPTYTTDIRPVMAKHCFMCHNPRVMAWADWTKYDNAFKARYKILSRVWTRRDMPPGGGAMTDKERKLIKQWVDEGAKK